MGSLIDELQEPRPAGRALSMSQFTLPARERGAGSASAPPVVCSGIATPASAICAAGQAGGSAEAADRPAGVPTESPQVRARGGDPHRKPTDETALPGTRRHGC